MMVPEMEKRDHNQKPKRKLPKPAKNPERVFEYAVWRLNEFGETSEKNLREKLTRVTDNQEWIDAAIAKLIELGYQSDRRFAEVIARKGLGSKRWGERRIEQEMKKKGINSDVIEEVMSSALSDDDPIARAQDALGKKFRGREIKEQKERARATRHLAGKGFSFDCISSAISRHNQEISEAEEL